jgi:hypothetical protein
VRIEPVENLSAIAVLPDIESAVAKRSTSVTTSRARDGTSRTPRRPSSFSTINVLPDVRLETSYRGNGLAGTQFLRGGGFPGSVIGTRNRGFGDALGPGVLE